MGSSETLWGGLRTKGQYKQNGIDEPLVSVVTVVLNGEEYIEETIQSVLSQTYANSEYIIVDGGSQDGTLSILRSYEDRIDYWRSESDRGIYDGMNKGIKWARGDIIGIINSDDYYGANTLQLVVDCFRRHPGASFVHGNVRFLNQAMGVTEIVRPRFEALEYANTLFHPTCFVRRSVYAEKLFARDYKLLADYELFLYARKKGWRFVHVDQPLATVRVGGASDRLLLVEDFKIKRTYFGLWHALKTNIPRQAVRLAETALGQTLRVIVGPAMAFRILLRVRRSLGKPMPSRG